jgi:hypothetical protein
MDRARDARRLSVALPLAGLLALMALPAGAPAAAAASDDLVAARDYCASVGGTVQARQATWNTNADESQWVDLGRSLEVCRFKADDGSRIYVDLVTLDTQTPTLASAAYLARVPMRDDLPPGDPATWYCADLDGSSQWGTGAAGGGWTNTDDPDDVIVDLCVFPDGSAIDEWGLAYHSDGTVRGADLATLFRADTTSFPPIFDTGDMGGTGSVGDMAQPSAPVDEDLTGGPALDTAAAQEAFISASRGGVLEVTGADGTVTTIAFPAGSVADDMTVVVTPLSEPVTQKGEPLTPGVLVAQAGSQDAHLQLVTPAIITFAIKGDVPDEAAVVTMTDADAAQPLASSISPQGKTTMVTAFVSAFSPVTVDGEPDDWGPLAPLTPDHRWSLAVSGTDSRTVQKVEMSLTAEGVLKGGAVSGKFAFNGMSGPLDLLIAASFSEGPVSGSLEGTKISGDAKLSDCWVQVANAKKGTFWLRGNGDLHVAGSATLIAQGKAGGTTMSKDLTSQSASAVKIGVKASGIPVKIGASVPATFTIYDSGYTWQYKARLTWVSR